MANPINWKRDSKSFDKVAQKYDLYRPSYPQELIQSAIELTMLKPGDEILEIGCGTGKATILLAQQGFSISCIEPGENLLRIARQKLKSFDVAFYQARFEEWEGDNGRYDAVVSAQAFHWVPNKIKYTKTAQMLKPDGHLLLIWNMYPYPQGDIFDTLDQIYFKHAPEISRTPGSNIDLLQDRAHEIEQSGFYTDLRIEKFPWSQTYSTKEYLGLLNTYSDHLRLSEIKKNKLLGAVAKAIDDWGGYLEKPYLAVLYIARKKPSR
jgi:ubiquinone/menaquinone biosynthesis C-methylase UbiE